MCLVYHLVCEYCTDQHTHHFKNNLRQTINKVRKMNKQKIICKNIAFLMHKNKNSNIRVTQKIISGFLKMQYFPTNF